MAEKTSKNTAATGALAVPDQHNPPPGYQAPIVCESVIDLRDVLVPMRDGKQLCVDVYRPDIDGKFPALLAIAPHNKEYQTPEFAAAVQWAQPAWSRTRSRCCPTPDTCSPTPARSDFRWLRCALPPVPRLAR